MTVRTSARTFTHAALTSVLALALWASRAQAADVLVLGSPDDDAQAAAQAVIASMRASILDHPWLGLSELDIALGSGADPREPVRQANRAVQAARDKFDELLIDDAAKLASSALEVYRDAFAHVTDPRQMTRALELMGAIALTREDYKTAMAAISEMAALAPQGTPSAALYNPPMLKKWQSIVRSYRAQKKQTLVVETASGPPATVEIDGRFRGLTPFTATDVLPGVHYVRVSRPGSIPYGGTVTVGKKTTRVIPTLAAADNSKLFTAARDDVWGADPEHKSDALARLAALLRVEYIILVTTTQRDGTGAGALTPVHAELYSTSKQRVLRTSDATFAVHPGSVPPLSRTFLDALLPQVLHLALAGTQPLASDSKAVAAIKRAITLSLGTLEGNAEVGTIAPVDDACLTDLPCMARARGTNDGVMTAKIIPSGQDVSVALTTYVGTNEASQVLIAKAHPGDTLLLAIADQLSHVFLKLEDLRASGRVVSTIPPMSSFTDAHASDAFTRPPDDLKRTTGIVTAGVGLGLTVAGFTIAGIENGVLGDAASSGSRKESARSLGRAGFIMGSVGIAAVIAGTVLWLTSSGQPSETPASGR